MIVFKFIAVFSDGVHSESVSCVASFVAKGALMTEATDVGLHMFFYRVSRLCSVITFGALP